MILSKYSKVQYTFFAIFLMSSTHLFASSKNSQGGMLDFNVYPYLADVANDSAFTLNIANKFNQRTSYFSLLNLVQANDGSDTVQYYTEQNLRWKVGDDSPLDLTLQLNFRSGDNNDRHRLGVRWRLSDTQALTSFFKQINFTYAINFHLIQFDHQPGNVWQMEHAFRLTFPYWTDKLYLGGFADHTFNEQLPETFPNNPIVAEIQLGYQIIENLYAVAEYRINQYRRSDVNNLALGIEYKILW